MKRSLGLFDVTCLGVNAIIGSGVFALPDDLYREMGPWSPLAFVLCAVGLAPVALCFAEAAARTERTGGPYAYASEAFGSLPGYVVGWMCLAASVVSFSAVATIAGAYLSGLHPWLQGPLATRALTVALIAAFAALNYAGAKPGARVTDALTVAKVAALLLLVVAAATAVDPQHFRAPLDLDRGDVGRAVFLSVFAAQGFEVAPVPAGETVSARRTVPIAVLVALLVSSLIYALVQTVLVGAHGPELGLRTDTPLADAARAIDPRLGSAMLAAGVVSTVGFVSGTALGTPRYLWATAVDGHLPKPIAKVHPRFGTPYVAVVVTCTAAALLAVLFDYRRLVGMANVTVAVQYLSTCIAVLVLRRRSPASRAFRAPLGPVLPALGVAMSIWIFTRGSRSELAFAAAALAIGLALAWGTRVARRRRAAPSRPHD